MDSGASKEVIHKISENLNKESTAAIVRTLLKLHKYGGTTEDKLVDTLVIDENVPALDAKVIVQSVLMAGVEFGAIVKVPDIVYKLDDEFYSFLVDYYSQNYEKSCKCETKPKQDMLKKYDSTKYDKKQVHNNLRRYESYIEQRRQKYKYKSRKRKLTKRIGAKKRAPKNRRRNKKETNKGGFWSSFWSFKELEQKGKKKLDKNHKTHRVRRKIMKSPSTAKVHSLPVCATCKSPQIQIQTTKNVQSKKNLSRHSSTLVNSRDRKYRNCLGSPVNVNTTNSILNRRRRSETELIAAFNRQRKFENMVAFSVSRTNTNERSKSKSITTKRKINYDKFIAPLCKSTIIPKQKTISKFDAAAKHKASFSKFMHSSSHPNSLISNQKLRSRLSAVSNKGKYRVGAHSASKINSRKHLESCRKSRSRTRCTTSSRRRINYRKIHSTTKIDKNKSNRKIKSDSVLIKSPDKGRFHAKSLIKILSQKKSISNTISKTKNKINQKVNIPDLTRPPKQTITQNSGMPTGTLLSSMGNMKPNWKTLRSKLNKSLVFSKNMLFARTNKKKSRRRIQPKRAVKNRNTSKKRARKNYAETLKRKKGPYSKQETKSTEKEKSNCSTKLSLNKSNKVVEYGKFYDSTNWNKLEKIIQSKTKMFKRRNSIDKTELSPRCITNALGEWYRLKKNQKKDIKSRNDISTKKRPACSNSEIDNSGFLPVPRRKLSKRKIESKTSMRSRELAGSAKKKRRLYNEFSSRSETSILSLPLCRKKDGRAVKTRANSQPFVKAKNRLQDKKRKALNSTLLVKSTTPKYLFPFVKKGKRQQYENQTKKEGRTYSNAYKTKNTKRSVPAYHKLKRMLRRLF